MELITPQWFDMRQGKAEPAGPDTYRLTAPNMKEAFITIRQSGDDAWSAALRATADGPDLAVTPADFPTAPEAWESAFELYRRTFVV
jgi:hypothetical protein